MIVSIMMASSREGSHRRPVIIIHEREATRANLRQDPEALWSGSKRKSRAILSSLMIVSTMMVSSREGSPRRPEIIIYDLAATRAQSTRRPRGS